MWWQKLCFQWRHGCCDAAVRSGCHELSRNDGFLCVMQSSWTSFFLSGNTHWNFIRVEVSRKKYSLWWHLIYIVFYGWLTRNLKLFIVADFAIVGLYGTGILYLVGRILQIVSRSVAKRHNYRFLPHLSWSLWSKNLRLKSLLHLGNMHPATCLVVR